MAIVKQFGFETGDLSEFDGGVVGNAARLNVTTAAAGCGTYGLAVDLFDEKNYALDTSFSVSVADWRVRFYLKLDDVVMSSGDNFRILHFNSPSGSALYAFVRNSSGVTQVRGQFYVDGGSFITMNVDVPSTGWHYVEMVVKRASSSTAADGVFEIYVDGTLAGSSTGNDIYDRGGPDEIRVGTPAADLEVGTSGTLYIDAIAIADTSATAIGPCSATVTGQAALSGAGALSTVAGVTVLGQASLAGTGALSAVAGAVTVPAQAALAGSGSAVASGSVVVLASAAMQGVGTLAGQGLLVVSGSAALNGSGSEVAAGLVVVSARGALSGVGSLVAAVTGTVAGSAALTGAGSLSATGSRGVTGQAALSGSGALSALAGVTALGQASLAGAGTLSGSALVLVPGVAVLSGQGNLVVLAILAVRGAATASGVGSLSGVGTVTPPTSRRRNGPPAWARMGARPR